MNRSLLLKIVLIAGGWSVSMLVHGYFSWRSGRKAGFIAGCAKTSVAATYFVERLLEKIGICPVCASAAISEVNREVREEVERRTILKGNLDVDRMLAGIAKKSGGTS